MTDVSMSTAVRAGTGGAVLIVDDSRISLLLLSEMLRVGGYQVYEAISGEVALAEVAKVTPELILLDINMPGMDGFEVCRKLKANPESAAIPVIFLSGLSDTETKLKGFEIGAVDYISKPFVVEEVLARVKTQVHLVQVSRQLEMERHSLEQKIHQRTIDLENANATLNEEIVNRRCMEDTLRLTSKYFETSFDSIFITDLKGTIVIVNPAFTRLMGYEEAEAVGKNANMLNSKKHDSEFFRTLWGDLFSKGYWSGEIWNRRKDGNVFPSLQTISACRNESGEIRHFISVLMDVSEQRDTQMLLTFLTQHDSLTGLPNRTLAGERFKQMQNEVGRGDDVICVMCLDIDRFRNVNDLFGHSFGDRILQMLTGRLKSCVPDTDILFRQGADEFIVIHRDIASLVSTLLLVDAIHEAIHPEFVDEEKSVSISMSIGIAVYPHDGNTLAELLSNAGTALARTQQQDGGGHVFFKAQMEAMSRSRFDIEMRLRHALKNQEFEVYYQPQVCFQSGKIVGAEALLRWKTADLGFISPAQFIPVAEETGHIIDIGVWVMNAVCEQLRAWQDLGEYNLKIAINLSGQQFRSANLSQTIAEILQRHGVDSVGIEFEITESAIINDVSSGVSTMHALKKTGASISLDDFGTGYSNLKYLKVFPVDYLKIDQSFIADLGTSADSDAILLSIVGLAHNLRLKVVAEGVETKAQLDFLKANGCDVFQGYYFSKPIPAAQFYALLLDSSARI